MYVSMYYLYYYYISFQRFGETLCGRLVFIGLLLDRYWTSFQGFFECGSKLIVLTCI